MTKLEIAPSLVGSSHRWPFDNKEAEIRLPQKPEWRDGILGNDKISCGSFRRYGTRLQPLVFDIHSVDLMILLPGKRVIPNETLGRVSDEGFTKRQRSSLDRLCEDVASMSDKAFEYWLRVLRWVTMNSKIGQPSVIDNQSGWSTHLLDETSGQPFYASGQTYLVPAQYPISKREWRRAQELLHCAEEPPIWVDFLFEAEHRLDNGDLHGGILSLAIGCESLLKKLFSLHARRPTNEKFLQLIDHTPTRAIIAAWEDLGFKTKAWKNAFDKKALNALYEERNRIVHRGRVKGLRATECIRYAAAVRKLVVYGEKYLRSKHETNRV